MVRRYFVPDNSKSVAKLVLIMQLNQGSTSDELATLAGWTKNHTLNVLTACRRIGQADSLRVGIAHRWHTLDQLPAAKQAEKERRRRVEQKRWAKRNHDCKLKKLAKSEDADSPADYFSHKVLPAGVPLPFTCQAPASVFHLGGV